ncbi:MAG: hypothetical protein AAGM84_17975 [Pseudomonadota bacterium]
MKMLKLTLAGALISTACLGAAIAAPVVTPTDQIVIAETKSSWICRIIPICTEKQR